jgi:glycosyltransferase involved in cell wall biosynthesis
VIFHAIDHIVTNTPYKITIVGNGVEENKFKSLIKEKYSNVVTHYNVMQKKDLFNLISNSDCLIHPSFLEGGANVVLEALAIGLPCIVSDIKTMHKEIIKNNYNGFLFNPNNHEELSEIMTYAIEHREQLWKMKSNCQESVKPYTVQNKIERYIELYKTSLK